MPSSSSEAVPGGGVRVEERINRGIHQAMGFDEMNQEHQGRHGVEQRIMPGPQGNQGLDGRGEVVEFT